MEAKDYALTVAAIAVAAVLGYLVYLVGISLIGPGHEGEGSGHGNAYEILLAALEKPAGYASYTYAYTDSIDGYPMATRVVEGQGFGAVSVTSPVFEKAIYIDGSSNVLCITFNQKSHCTELGQNSSLAQSFASMRGAFLGSKAASSAHALEIYNRSGAITFEGAPAESQVNGTACSRLKYTLDYNKLSLSDLQDLGISPSDPAILYSRNYTFEYCIDNQSNVLSVKLDYVFLGQQRTTQTTVTEARWGLSDRSELAHAAPVAENETYNLFLDAISAERTVLACSKNATTASTCIRDYAVTQGLPDICLLAGDRKDKCILTLIGDTLRADLCGKVDDLSLKDDCWVESGAGKKDASFCANIANETKKQLCLSLANGTANIGGPGGANSTVGANTTYSSNTTIVSVGNSTNVTTFG